MSATTIPGATSCRACGVALDLTLVDLGKSPLCESFLPAERLEEMEPFYPLHVRVCTNCWLAQLPSFVPTAEIFRDYPYFSAYSDSWVAHALAYVEMITTRLRLTGENLVVELASNDGYLLQHFVAEGIPVLGIDPAENVAEAANARRVPTIVDFFTARLAEELVADGRRADLIIGNNVLAQVPDINDFVQGVSVLLAPGGTATFEFPHLASLVDGLQYDTIYHEHYSYFSLHSICHLFAAHGLAVVDVDELASHGGSLRIYVRPSGVVEPAASVSTLLANETAAGLQSPDRYPRFAAAVEESKHALLEMLIGFRRAGKQVVGYGAPGKGNTLLNYCGIRTDLLDYTVDRNPYKHGRYTPGTHIPIYSPEMILETKPDVIVILPWNLAREISHQLAYSAEWDAKLVVPIPNATILSS